MNPINPEALCSDEPIPGWRPVWFLQEGIELVRKVDAISRPFGYTTALSGGVLFHGYSFKDLDIIFYRLKTQEADQWSELQKALDKFGFKNWEYRTDYHEGDNKPVYFTQFDGRRVDLILCVPHEVIFGDLE